MRCKIERCNDRAAVCESCYRMTLHRYEELLGRQNDLVRETHDLQAEIARLRAAVEIAKTPAESL